LKLKKKLGRCARAEFLQAFWVPLFFVEAQNVESPNVEINKSRPLPCG
jgi:hypothetical protein